MQIVFREFKNKKYLCVFQSTRKNYWKMTKNTTIFGISNLYNVQFRYSLWKKCYDWNCFKFEWKFNRTDLYDWWRFFFFFQYRAFSPYIRIDFDNKTENNQFLVKSNSWLIRWLFTRTTRLLRKLYPNLNRQKLLFHTFDY